jgi:UDP-N-acetylmuramate--alanine ligase
VPVAAGHDPAHLDAGFDWLVRSAAVQASHSEVAAALALGIPVFRRGAVLPALLDGRTAIAVSGTHGKTTTTAMLAQVYRGCGVHAGFSVGGEVDGLGGVADAGRDPVLIVEADESDGTVSAYETDYAVVTNAELDHVDHFESERAVHDCLGTFCGRARRAAVVCGDDPGALAAGSCGVRMVLFGFGADCDWRATKLEESARSIAFTLSGPRGLSLRVQLPVSGRHNVLNALAALAVAGDAGLPLERAAAALAAYAPARRRFEQIAEGGGITVISDYAHHPTEIRAMMSQARRLRPARTVAVFQPHRYSRTRMFASAFADAFSGVDALVLAPVYAASEPLVPGGRSQDVFPLFALRHAGRAQLAESLEDAWARVRALLRPGDLLLVVGAGDVEKIAFQARDLLQSAGASPK